MLVPGRKPGGELDALDLFSRIDVPVPGTTTTVPSAERRKSFHEKLNIALDQSLSNRSRLHGWRVQGLFEAMIVSLGAVRMIKEEDAGRYFFDDGYEVRPADFRIITAAGEHLLVEVKGVNPSGKTKPQRVRIQDLDPLSRYAKLTGARLLFAHYWSSLNLWTLVDASVLVPHDGRKLVLDFKSAMMANELGLVGDAHIGTEAPLAFSFIADLADQERVDRGAHKEFRFKVGAVERASGGRVLTEPQQQKIAWFLMMHGRWPSTEQPVVEGGRLVRINYEFRPAVPDDEDHAEAISRQGFALVDSLSSMYSNAYNDATLTEDGEIRVLRHEPDPGALAALVPSSYWETRESDDLPIWKLVQSPSR